MAARGGTQGLLGPGELSGQIASYHAPPAFEPAAGRHRGGAGDRGIDEGGGVVPLTGQQMWQPPPFGQGGYDPGYIANPKRKLFVKNVSW